VNGLTPSDRHFNRRLSIDPRKYRKDAIVLDAEAGDLIYWPSEYWHVSEPRSEDFSAMLSLGLFRPAVIGTALQPLSHAAMLSQRIAAAAKRADAAQELRWITGFGFERGGPLLERPRGSLRTIPKEITVRKIPGHRILWKPNVARDRMLVAANGHSITLPQSAALIQLLEQLSSGGSATISNAGKRKSAARAFETNWNRRCQLTTRKRTSQRDPRVLLVDWLLRVHAVERDPACP
jgi:ribosomal protein L28